MTTPSPRRPAADGDEPLHSVHGGVLAVDDRVLRAQVARQLFGTASGVQIGRFRVKRLIGAGGMGQVFEAEDPQLDRSVAVKVLRPLGDVDRERARARMEREAKAQARIKDPHVVTVHEVGPFEDGLYIAMELVEGPNLRQWLEQPERPWSAVLGKFVQAGLGLAAAHRRGLVHRDFKPDNVLIDGEDERARVADFGLVQVGAEPSDLADAATPGDVEPEVTVGAGTPEYMSPEQRRGEVVDARSDQFSFCIALRAALVRSSAPPKVLRVVERGLAGDPASRHADMIALLAALQRAAAPGGRAWWIAGGTAAALAIAIAAWPRAPDCEAAGELGDTWTDAQRTSATARVEQSSLHYLASAWPATQQALDDWADRWRAQSVRACELEATRDDELALRSRDCLDMLRDDLGFLATGLAQGEDDVLASSLQLVGALPEPEVCNDEPRLDQWIRPADAAALAQRNDVRQAVRTAALALAAAQSRSSEFERSLADGTTAAEQARAGAVALGDAGLEARALLLLGELALHAGRHADAESLLEQSAARAESAGDNRARVRALSLRAYVIGDDHKRLREALQVAAQAEAVLATLDDPTLLRARLLTHVGTVKAKAGAADRDEGIDDLRQAIELLTSALGEGHPEVLGVRVNLGNTLARAGQVEASRDELLAAAAAAPGVWGDEHPFTARVQGMLGMALLRTGDLPGARRNLEEALRKSEAALGPDHHEVGDAHYNLATLLQRTEEHALAAEHLRVGLAERERSVGPRDLGLIAWLYALGKSELELGQHEHAERSLRRALELCELGGAIVADFARVRFALARAIVDRNPDEAKFLAMHAAQAYRELDQPAPLAKVETFLAERFGAPVTGP